MYINGEDVVYLYNSNDISKNSFGCRTLRFLKKFLNHSMSLLFHAVLFILLSVCPSISFSEKKRRGTCRRWNKLDFQPESRLFAN